MLKSFTDVLDIYNGKNQKQVEDIDGVYPIYGSGGIMGYANDYICPESTVIIGRKGSINKPIYVTSPLWNVDTAFGLVAKKDILNPKYLYYFCEYFDFERLNTTVTIPSLTKANLLKIRIEVPELNVQANIVERLDKVNYIIQKCQEELEILDKLVKSRFVEMFGELLLNPMAWDEYPLGAVCDKVVRYPTLYGMEYLPSGTRVIRIGNILPDGHMELNDENYVFVYDTVNKDFPETVIELNDIIMAVRGDGSAAKRIGIVTESNLIGANISPNLIRIKVNNAMLNPIYMFYYLTGEAGQKRLDAYVNKTAKKNIAAKDIVKIITPVPPLPLQNDFATFVTQTTKLKLVG